MLTNRSFGSRFLLVAIIATSFLGCATDSKAPAKSLLSFSTDSETTPSFVFSANEPISQISTYANKIKSAYDNFKQASQLLSWLIANDGALRYADPTVVVGNLPSLSSQNIRQHVAALVADITIPSLEYVVISQLPQNYPLSNNSEPFHAKLFETIRYNEQLTYAIDNLIDLEDQLSEHKRQLNLIDESLRDVATDPVTGAFWQLYLKYEHFDLLLISKPAVSNALSTARRNRSILEKKLAHNRQAAQTTIQRANVPIRNAISWLNLRISAWEEDQNSVYAEGKELSRIQDVQTAKLINTREMLERDKLMRIDLVRRISITKSNLASKITELSNTRRLLRNVNTEISAREHPYDCNGGAHHSKPFKRNAEGNYVCWEQKSIDTRQRWGSQNQRKQRARTTISRLERQIPETRSDLDQMGIQRDRLVTSIEEAENGIDILEPLIETRATQIEKLLEVFWNNRNEAAEYEEKLLLADKALSDLQDISYEINY